MPGRQAGEGGLVLYAWDGPWRKAKEGRRMSVPMHGSTLIGLSAYAARAMYQYFDEWFEMHHWDVSLYNCLEENADTRKIAKHTKLLANALY